MVTGTQSWNTSKGSSPRNDTPQHQPAEGIGEPQVLGESRQSLTSFDLAYEWLYEADMKDQDTASWNTANTYPAWADFQPPNLQIVDDHMSNGFHQQQLHEPSSACPLLARSTEPNQGSNAAEELHVETTIDLSTYPRSVVSRNKKAAASRYRRNTEVARTKASQKASRQARHKKITPRKTARHHPDTSGHLPELACGVRDPYVMPDVAFDACSLWQKSFPRSFPKDEEIVGLQLAFHAPAHSIRSWFQKHSGTVTDALGCQADIDQEDDVTLEYQRNRRKCNGKGINRTSHSSSQSILRDGTQPYACTSRCGASFDSKDCWRRHEEINYPQELWLCTIGSCRNRPSKVVRLRKDHFRSHLRKRHGYNTTSEEDLDSFYFPIPSLFDRRCILRKCGKRFKTWRQRIDHIAKELEGPWNISD